MKIELTYVYNSDEVKDHLAYALIVESMGGSKWGTESIQRKLKEEFSKEELSCVHAIYSRCNSWYYRGIGFDREIRIPVQQHEIWLKLKDFCIRNFTIYGQNK